MHFSKYSISFLTFSSSSLILSTCLFRRKQVQFFVKPSQRFWNWYLQTCQGLPWQPPAPILLCYCTAPALCFVLPLKQWEPLEHGPGLFLVPLYMMPLSAVTHKPWNAIGVDSIKVNQNINPNLNISSTTMFPLQLGVCNTMRTRLAVGSPSFHTCDWPKHYLWAQCVPCINSQCLLPLVLLDPLELHRAAPSFQVTHQSLVW